MKSFDEYYIAEAEKYKAYFREEQQKRFEALDRSDIYYRQVLALCKAIRDSVNGTSGTGELAQVEHQVIQELDDIVRKAR